MKQGVLERPLWRTGRYGWLWPNRLIIDVAIRL